MTLETVSSGQEFGWQPAVGTFRGLPWYQTYPQDSRRCTACGQSVTVYQRGISAVVARALIRLYLLDRARPEKPWHHVKEIFRDRGDWAKLKFFGLIEEAENVDARKRTSGYWRITPFGRAFAAAQVGIPKYALVGPGSALVGFVGPQVTVKDCVEYRHQFCYADLIHPESSP